LRQCNLHDGNESTASDWQQQPQNGRENFRV
jgi:hypothetical protein